MTKLVTRLVKIKKIKIFYNAYLPFVKMKKVKNKFVNIWVIIIGHFLPGNI